MFARFNKNLLKFGYSLQIYSNLLAAILYTRTLLKGILSFFIEFWFFFVFYAIKSQLETILKRI